MEEKSSSYYDGAVNWFLRVSRLAVAVAIIKSRPSEGVKAYTEYLCKALKEQDEGYKSKARGLQEDLLHLRQELVLTRSLLKAERRPRPPKGQEVVDLSQDDTRALKSDSGCDIDMSAHGAEAPCLPLTPPNSQNAILQGMWRQDRGLVKHMQFLQCLSSLRRDYGLSLGVDDDGVVWDSVVQLLDCVLEVFRQAHFGQAVRHPELLRHATQVMAQVLGGGKTDRWPSFLSFSKVEDLLKEMIGLLLTSHRLNEFSVNALLSECVMTLGESRVTRVALVRILMSHIVQLAQHLWDICQSTSDLQLDWIRYENSFYVFWLLEQLSADGHVELELITRLETQAFSLSDEFPLFSLYMWRIGGLYRTTSVRPNETQCSCEFSGQHTQA